MKKNLLRSLVLLLALLGGILAVNFYEFQTPGYETPSEPVSNLTTADRQIIAFARARIAGGDSNSYYTLQRCEDVYYITWNDLETVAGFYKSDGTLLASAPSGMGEFSISDRWKIALHGYNRRSCTPDISQLK